MNELSQDSILEFCKYMENNFFDKFNAVKQRLQEDVEAINFEITLNRIVDFGCGPGFTTLSLMSVLKTSQVIGVDKDDGSITQAKTWFEWGKKYVQLCNEFELTGDELEQQVHKLLEIPHFPEFRVGDVTTSNELPDDIDLAYCKRLLVNIKNESKNKVTLAVEKIVGAIKPGGWFIAVEETQGGNFSSLFQQTGLEQVKIVPCQIFFTRYVYKKPTE